MSQLDDDLYCALPLARYACRPDRTRGRFFAEGESAHRTPFQRDRDRIIHSTAFRRLKYKTQVFVYHEGDHYRTRLTHTLEVAQIARTIARALRANEDLAEAVALAHDLGHPPFAHTGEEELIRRMATFGGFDHNDQSLRVVTYLEKRYPNWDGLNLTWETLEGIIKHNGPVDDAALPATLARLSDDTDFELAGYASLEAQIAGLSDDIAYNNHDVEDGILAGLLPLEDVVELTLFKSLYHDLRAAHPALERRRVVAEMVREMIGAMVVDVLQQTRSNLAALDPQSPHDIRNAGRPMVTFSPQMESNLDELRDFLFSRMYHHPSVRRMRFQSEKIVGDLFETYMHEPPLMPIEWHQDMPAPADSMLMARHVCDCVASMTDRAAIAAHQSLFGLYV